MYIHVWRVYKCVYLYGESVLSNDGESVQQMQTTDV